MKDVESELKLSLVDDGTKQGEKHLLLRPFCSVHHPGSGRKTKSPCCGNEPLERFKTDVSTIKALPQDVVILVHGHVLDLIIAG